MFSQSDLATYGESGGPTLAAGEAVDEMIGGGWGTILPRAHHIDLASTFAGGDK